MENHGSNPYMTERDMPAERPQYWALVAFELDRAYGGPEEGGWYYDCGQFVRVIGTHFGMEEDAFHIANRLNNWLGRLQRDQRSIGSVLYGGGRYGISAYPVGKVPGHWPEQRPYYE